MLKTHNFLYWSQLCSIHQSSSCCGFCRVLRRRSALDAGVREERERRDDAGVADADDDEEAAAEAAAAEAAEEEEAVASETAAAAEAGAAAAAAVETRLRISSVSVSRIRSLHCSGEANSAILSVTNSMAATKN